MTSSDDPPLRYSRALERCHNIVDLRDRARRRLPRPVFDFLDGGAETEMTARRNTAVFDEVKIVPHCLVDVATVRTATRVMGQDLEWPLICSPTGASRLFHQDGELAAARAAARSGAFYGLSTGSTYSLEDVAAAGKGPKLFQLYLFKDRGITRQLIERCTQSGYAALCLTVDVPVAGKRERDLRSGFRIRPKWSLNSLANFARHPLWVMQRVGPGALAMANFPPRPGRSGLADELDPSVTWKDVRAIRQQWKGPFVLKGVMSVEDARRAADEGVTALMISNHGGRQLDGAVTPLEALPQIHQAVGDRLELILDGGVRRGVHILKALAQGAKACSIGRSYLYGLSAAGEAGMARALDILRTELVLAMKLSGCTDVRNIDQGLSRWSS